MYFNCLAVVSDRGLCGGGEDVFDVNEGKNFSRNAQALADRYKGKFSERYKFKK